MVKFIIFFIILLLFIYCVFIYYRVCNQGPSNFTSTYEVLKGLPKDKYIVFQNVSIKYKKQFFNIDYVVVSVYGIFVITSKNFIDGIFGSEIDEKWRNTNHGRSYLFPNPINQTENNIEVLMMTTRQGRKAFHPIVVFKDKASLYVNAAYPIVRVRELRNYIGKFKTEIFTKKDVIKIANWICDVNINKTYPKTTK